MVSRMIVAASPSRNKRGQFQQGSTGNPAGRPRGSRNRLGEEFLSALFEDFHKHGLSAIQECRLTNPSVYIRTIASLLPKETPDTPSDEFANMSIEELRTEIIRMLSGELSMDVEKLSFRD